MAIVLFAIIGAKINAGAGYWICFAVYCMAFVLNVVYQTLKERL